MSCTLLMYALSNLYYFALHICSTNSFPKPLSASEELECIKKISAGDETAKTKLIEHNLRLVAHIMKKYYSACKDQEDLISIGTIGLIKAANTFDYEKGTKFATYASRCIENEILMYFRSRKKTLNDVYINDPLDTDSEGNCLTLMDLISDSESMIDIIDLKIKSDKLYKLLNEKLTKRERRIIIMRYGLYDTAPLTQRETAKHLGISRSYVSRIEKKALQTLHDEFEKHKNGC